MRALLVNGNRWESQTLARELAALGHEAVGAAGTVDALELALSYLPDVVCIEPRLRDGSVDDLAAQLRRFSELRGCTIVGLSEAPWSEDGHGRSMVDLFLTRDSFVSAFRSTKSLG